jgi:hypothetical protein
MNRQQYFLKQAMANKHKKDKEIDEKWVKS